MRFWSRLGEQGRGDELDPTLTEFLRSRDSRDDLDSISLARARMRVEARLRDPGSAAELRPRFALSGFGAAGLWASFTGVAAANKAAAVAVTVSMVLGGAVAETSGVGPAVREAVLDVVTSAEEPPLFVESRDSSDVQGPTATPETLEAPAAASSAAVAAPMLPGNLVTQLGPDGSFHIRAEIAGANGSVLTLLTSEGDLTLDVAGATAHANGNPSVAPLWSDYIGYGVFVSGTCPSAEAASESALGACGQVQVSTVQLLGRAGQGGQPESLPRSEQASGPGPREIPAITPAAEAPGRPENPGPPNTSGRPEDVGPPPSPGPSETSGPPESSGPSSNPAASDDAGPPDTPGPPEETGLPAASAAPEDNGGPPDDAGPPEHSGPPEDAGPP